MRFAKQFMPFEDAVSQLNDILASVESIQDDLPGLHSEVARLLQMPDKRNG